MRSFLTLLMVAAFALSCGCAASAKRNAEPVQLTVMTYNIHHTEGMDKKLDLERIADVIRRCEADLVALQEVDQGTRRTIGVDQPAELAQLTKMHHAYGPAMEYQGGKYGNAILSRFEIVCSRVVALPYTPGGRREPRSAVAATVRLPGGRAVVFISTHLDHTPEPSDRLEQARTFLGPPFTKQAVPRVLAGDFNCESDSAPMKILQPHWSIVTDGDPANTCPADSPRIKIDHVLVSPRAWWQVVETRVIDEPVASDHRPVLVKLKLVRPE